MRTFCTIIAVLLVTPFFPQTNADAQPKLQFASALVYPFSLKDGQGLPPTASHSLVSLFPLSTNWNATARVGFSSDFIAFRPSPRGFLGINYRLHTTFRLGVSVGYAYVPHWDGTPGDAHLVSGALIPIFPLPNDLVLAFPLGITHNFTTRIPSGSIAMELAVPISFH